MHSETLIRITSLEDLVKALKEGLYREVLEQSEDLTISLKELTPYTHWNKQHYTRNCIARDEYFELILLCWEKGQKTAIHCHDNQECWVKIISGEFVETIYEIDEASNVISILNSDVVSQNEVTTMQDVTLFHTLENLHKGRSMSLHLYMKPIDQCRYLDEQTNEIKTTSLSYYSLHGKLL